MRLYRKQYAYPVVFGKLRATSNGEAITISPSIPTELKEEIGYWRKANHIHRWFVENVQESQDDGTEYDVERHKLAQLLQTVILVLNASELIPGKVSVGYYHEGGKRIQLLESGRIIKDPEKAETLLPTQEGFFFGKTDYDEDYYADLVWTIEVLEAALKSPLDVTFTYQSSW